MNPIPHSLIEIRAMQAADLAQVAALDQRAFTDPWPQGAFAYELEQNPFAINLVAVDQTRESQQTIIGALVLWLVVDEAHIATVAVDTAHRHQKIGLRLMARGLIEAASRGAVRSLLEVRAGNQAALHLYYGLGYKAVGLRPRYYKDNGEDALLLDLDRIEPEKLRSLLA